MTQFNFTYIFTHFDEQGIPYSNNVAGFKHIVNSGQNSFPTPYINLNDICEDVHNYAFLINLDFIGKPDSRCSFLLDSYLTLEYKLPAAILDLLNQRRCTLIYYSAAESFDTEQSLISMYSAADKLGFPYSQLLLVTGSLNIDAINVKLQKKYNYETAIRVVGSLMFGRLSASWLRKLTTSSYVARLPLRKKFICLNRVNRMHRVNLFALICRNTELFDSIFYSMQLIDVFNNKFDCRKTTGIGLINSKSTLGITHAEFDNAVSKLPLMLDTIIRPTIDPVGADIYHFYQTSLFNIITETLFYDSITLDEPRQFLTEKIFKPFAVSQIPILVGGVKVIEKLRELGFGVFDDIVDHSYDYEFDNDLRMLKVVKEITRINSSYTLPQCEQLALTLTSRFRHNHEVLLSLRVISDTVPFYF